MKSLSTSAINVGTVETEYRIRDLGKESIDKIVSDIGRLEKISKSLTSALKVENDKVAASYSKLAASLDPVTAANQKHARGLETLDSALKKGIITQDQYTASVAKLNSQLSAPGDRARALADIKAREAATKAATLASREQARALQASSREQARILQSLAKDEARARDIAAKASAASARETAKLEASYKKLAAALDPLASKEQKYKAALTILDAALRKGIITQEQYNIALRQAAAQFHETATRADKYTANLLSGLKSQIAAYVSWGAAIAVALKVFHQFIDAHIEAQDVTKKVEAAVSRSTSGVTANQINDLADSYSRLTGIDDELIAGAEATALKFNRLGSDIFPRVTAAAIDMSVATGQDLSSSFERVGKIINQPLRGLTLLSKEGYAVAKSQSDLVKQMVAVGDIVGAQGVLLGILESQYKGSAVAARDTLGGALQALGTTWENLLEKIGEDKLGPARQGIEEMITLLQFLTDQWDYFLIGVNDVANKIDKAVKFMADSVLSLGIVYAKVMKSIALDNSQMELQWHRTEVQLQAIKIRLDAGADKKIADRQVDSFKRALPWAKALDDALSGMHKRGTVGAQEQTEAEAKLNDELKKQREEIEKILASTAKLTLERMESLSESVAVILTSIKNENDLADAISKGEIAYNQEAQAQARANIVQSETNKLTKEHKQYIDKLIEAKVKLLEAGSASGAAGVEATIQSENKAFEDRIKLLEEVIGATFDQKEVNTQSLASIKQTREQTNEYNTALAQLYDALNNSTSATLANSIAIEAESIKLSKNADEGSKLAKIIDLQTKKRLTSLDAIKRQTEALKKLNSLKQEADFSGALLSIDTSLSSAERQIEERFISLLQDLGQGSIDAGYEVLEELSKKFGITIDEIKANLNKIADAEFVIQIREDLKTPNERYKEYIRLVEQSSLTVIEKEKEISRVREELFASKMQSWNTLFSFLGDKFGGVIQQISQALDNIQAAYQQGKSLDSSGFGGAMSGSWGAMFATVQIMYEIYKAVDKKIEERKAKTWSDVTSLEVINGQMSSPSYFSEQGREISSSLRNALEEIIDSLGGVIDDLPKIVIRARKDSKEFSAYVAGIWVGTFKSAEEALQQAVASALQMADFAFISKEFAHVLERSIGATLEELQQNLDVARTVRGARLGNVGESYLDISDRMRQESEAAKRLGLSISDLISARQKEQQSLIDQTLGINTATAQRLRDLRSLDAGIREAAGGTRTYLEQQINRLNEEILRIASIPPSRRDGGTGMGGSGEPRAGERPGGWNAGGGGGAGVGNRGGQGGFLNSSFDGTLDQLHRELLGFLNQLEEIPEALSEAQMRMGVFDTLYSYVEGQAKYAEEAYKYAVMKVDAEFKALRLELEILGMWEEFAEMFNDAYNAQIQTIGRNARGGAGGGIDTTSGVKDFIEDREFDIAARSMSEVERQIAELNREYDRQEETLGRNSPLLARLNELRAQEIELIRQQQIENMIDSFQNFLGLVSPFQSIRDTAEDLIQQIEDSPFGDARKARMIGRVLGEVERQLDRMSQEMAAGVFGDLIANLERYGAEESLMAEARRQLAILEHTMTLINLRERIETLKLERRISDEVIGTMERSLAFLEGIDPTLFINPTSIPAGPDYDDGTWQWTGAGWVKKAPGEDTSSIDAARDLLSQYQDQALDSLTRELNKINADFTTISSALGNTAEVLSAKNRAIAAAIDEFLQPIRDFRNEMDFSDTSVLNVEDQFQTIQAQFRDLADGATLQDRDKLLELADRYINLADEFTGGEAFRFIDAEVKGVLDRFLSIAPGSTTLGSTTNPMSISAPSVQSAIENGNTAIVTELRTHGGLLISVNNRLQGVESQLSNTLNVRNIA